MMKAAQIIAILEDFVRQSVRHTYPLLGKEDYPFLSGKSVVRDGCLQLDENCFLIPSFRRSEIDYLQIPQTRILVYNAHNEQGRVFIMRLPDTVLVALDVLGNEETISVETAQGWKTILLDGIIQTKEKNKSLFKTSSGGVFILTKNSAPIKPDKISRFLSDMIISEKKIHPLSHFHAGDKTVMSEIDRLWARLYPVISVDRNIDQSKVADEPELWLWLQEVYLYFGWYAEPETFYTTNDLSYPNSIIQPARYRYRTVAFVTESDKTLEETEMEKDTFLYFYLSGWRDSEETLLDKIQNKWESISSPARAEYLKRAVRDDTDEYIAFALLARQLNFHWAGQAAEKIENHLEGTIKDVFCLLILLQEKIVSFVVNKRVRLRAGKENAERVRLSHAYFKFASSRFGKDIFTDFSADDGFEIQIDKAVLLDISFGQKRIRIKPPLCHPPDDGLDYQYLTISDERQTIQVPLVWRSFRLQNKKWRIKFLLKKNRFQLSIRIFERETRLKIGHVSVDSVEKNHFKLYWPVEKSPGKIVFSLLDEKGNRMYSLYPGLNTIYFRGYGLDRYGLLQEKFNVFLNDSKKSEVVRLNEPQSQIISIQLNSGFNKLKLAARGCEPIEEVIPMVSGYTQRFLSADSILLKELMIIYMEQSDKKEIEEVRYRVKDNLGFWPCVRPIDTIRWERSHFIFILDSTLPFEYKAVDDYNVFQILQPVKKKNVYAIYISKENKDYLFSDIFFQKMARLESQNKFDFKK